MKPPPLALSAAALAALVGVALWRRWRGGRRTVRTPLPPPPDTGPSAVPIASSAAELATHVRSEGVCLIESVLDRGALAELEGALNALEPRKLQNRRKHRWEHVHSPEAAPYVQLASQPQIAAAVRTLLGPKTYLEKAGMLVSHPGAEAQRWHMDTPHLFTVGAHLPPHSLSVFVPLVDLTPANGPTEFQLGTHVKANLVAPQRHALACCPAGSLVVYDIRVMHRGGPNVSDAKRPVVYLTFSRVWYRDTLNP